MTAALTIRELPRTDRPRERLLDLGAHALSTAELLAIVVGSGGRGRSALRIGDEVLSFSHGSLRRLASRPVSELTRQGGIGRAKAVVIHAALELGRRMAAESRDESTPI